MMVGLMRLYCSLGACVLAAGLLLGAGGAVAAADTGTDSSVSSQGTQETNASAEQQTTAAPVRRNSSWATFTRRLTRIARAATDYGSIATGAAKPTAKTSGKGTPNETTAGSNLGAAVVDPVAAVPNDVTPVSDGAPGSDLVTAVPNEVAPVSDPAAPLAAPEAPLPHVSGPVSSVSALVPGMVSSVVGAVLTLTQPPSDLRSFLMGVAGAQPLVGGADAVGGGGLPAAAGASVASRSPLGASLAGDLEAPRAGASGLPVTGLPVTGLPVTGGTTGAPLDVSALGRVSAESGIAPPAPDAVFAIRAGSSLPRVLGGIVLSVSLSALAAAALPGAGGLGLITLAGVRVGYRQAKAGIAVRTTGIAHFARQGPLGIVRSGSQVAVHPRASRVVRPPALTAEHLLDEVA